MEKGVRRYPSHPRVALTYQSDRLPETVTRRGDIAIRRVLPILERSVQQLDAHYHQAGQETDEMFVVFRTLKVQKKTL